MKYMKTSQAGYGKELTISDLVRYWDYKIQDGKLVEIEKDSEKNITHISGDGYLYLFNTEEIDDFKYKPFCIKYNYNTKKVEKVFYYEEK